MAKLMLWIKECYSIQIQQQIQLLNIINLSVDMNLSSLERIVMKKKMQTYISEQNQHDQIYTERLKQHPNFNMSPFFSKSSKYESKNQSQKKNCYNYNPISSHNSPSPTATPQIIQSLLNTIQGQNTLDQFIKMRNKKNLKNFPKGYFMKKSGKILQQQKSQVELQQLEICEQISKQKQMPQNQTVLQQTDYSPKFTKKTQQIQPIHKNSFSALLNKFNVSNMQKNSKSDKFQRPPSLKIKTIQEKLKESAKLDAPFQYQNDINHRGRVFTFSRQLSKSNQITKKDLEKSQDKKRNRSKFHTSSVYQDTGLNQKYEKTLQRLQRLKQKVLLEIDHKKVRRTNSKQDYFNAVKLYNKYSPIKKLKQSIIKRHTTSLSQYY